MGDFFCKHYGPPPTPLPSTFSNFYLTDNHVLYKAVPQYFKYLPEAIRSYYIIDYISYVALYIPVTIL